MAQPGKYDEYQSIAELYDYVIPYRNRPDVVFFVEAAKKSGGAVLEAGCGTGRELIPAAWRINLLGIITGSLSGPWNAIYTQMGRSASQRGLNPWTTLVHTFGFAAVLLLGFNLLSGGHALAGESLDRVGRVVPAGGGENRL